MRSHLALRIALTFALSSLVVSPASAQAPCHAENDGPNFADNVSMSTTLLAIQFTAPSSFSATELEIFTGEASALHGLQLWSHDPGANRPLALLAGGTVSVAAPNQWYRAPLSSNVALTGGQTYWFAWDVINGAQAAIDSLNSGLGQPYTASTNGGLSWGNLFQFANRHWKIRLYGACGGPPVVYCTAGTTSSGCTAQIAASGQPSVTLAAPCAISVANVEGQKTGIVFYGLQALPQAWCGVGVGTSFLCVKPPTQRSFPQTSGGTANTCTGALALDWNAFQSATPGALGAPWSVGDRAYVQAWFRDPLACRTTSLSDAIELTYVP
jgi:hypothetical protein